MVAVQLLDNRYASTLVAAKGKYPGFFTARSRAITRLSASSSIPATSSTTLHVLLRPFYLSTMLMLKCPVPGLVQACLGDSLRRPSRNSKRLQSLDWPKDPPVRHIAVSPRIQADSVSIGLTIIVQSMAAPNRILETSQVSIHHRIIACMISRTP